MRWLLALTPLLALACASPGPPPVLDAALPEGRLTRPLASLLAGGGLAPGSAQSVRELGRDAHTSHHLVWIRDAEIPHRHDQHDLLVVILRGHGRMLLGHGETEVGEGSILYVPRGRVHAFRNQSDQPAAAYVVYVPPFDGRDRVLAPGLGGPGGAELPGSR